ncbi:UbiD family decarboxylase [Rhodoplanes sp. Z2-YC6860]|uniref:UbiD family decarboxylase n=1 Tax=Rhodoplanes sp. Z2-YC6860 TaxID=674703 RepID=UPI00078C3CD5|nr:UbiD family decarboxylase [Rhodoplanes sp. Z2-YC6860]AMN45342.1 UbiD family decarboxylase [Rhodoplanes sp. Z2-YC6860]
MPALTSFRSLIDSLERSGTLRSISRPVDPRHELIAVMRAVQKAGNEPLLFTAVAGSPSPVATNILGRREVLALALGLEPQTLLPSLLALGLAQLDPMIVSDAPVHEVVQTSGFDVARDIPQVVHSERDAGAYISAGICIARHPTTGIVNASWNRIQLAGGDHTRVRMMPPQHLGQYQRVAEESGEPMPVAVVIGAPPALMLSAASKIPIEADEYRTAGGWQREPLRLVRAKTVPLDVPADAEFVIEGHVLPHVREAEGPFGEFTDGYVEVGPNHVLKVSAITRRRDAIYHVILAGGSEDTVLLGVPLMVDVWKKVAPLADIRDIGFPGHIFGCVISLAKTDDLQPKAVLEAALAAHLWMKLVVVVDADVDPHDPQDVLWAIHTRHRPDTGIVRIENAAGFPRADVRAVHRGKIGLDATAPLAMKETFRRRRFLGIETISPEDYFDPV